MSGPWYECVGPTAKEVRRDVLNHINIVKIGFDPDKKEKDKIINDALMKIIPDSRNDFGSWRGYATFGVMQEVAGEVMKEIRLKYSQFILRKEFLPHVTHYLYKPGGLRFIKVAKSTLVGKDKVIENPEDEF